MAKKSAGILLYRRDDNGLAVLLVHPGGPFWSRKDLGAWSIPKGEYDDGEDPEAAALREFEEELGTRLVGDLILLDEIVQSGGKRVTAFVLEGDLDAAAIKSTTFSLEWPPRSGQMQTFPEVDRAEWFVLPEAADKLLPSQRPLLDSLIALLRNR